MRERYSAAQRAIAGLEDALKEFGVPEIETLSDLTEGFEEDELLSKFDKSELSPETSGLYGVTIWETRQNLQILKRAVRHALEQISTPRGARPKEPERWLAIEVMYALEDAGITPTTYDGGVFFAVLEILFADCFRDCKPESYRRHGTYALEYGIERDDDSNVKHLPERALQPRN